MLALLAYSTSAIKVASFVAFFQCKNSAFKFHCFPCSHLHMLVANTKKLWELLEYLKLILLI